MFAVYIQMYFIIPLEIQVFLILRYLNVFNVLSVLIYILTRMLKTGESFNLLFVIVFCIVMHITVCINIYCRKHDRDIVNNSTSMLLKLIC